MIWTWLGLAALGAGHGINPGMGWLFAVALGMQEGGSRAVWRALPPLAVGHGLAIATVLVVAAAVGVVVPPETLRCIVGILLVALGALRLARHRHPSYGGMRVGFRELTIWSFLMATAHGAGLMVLPLVVGISGSAGHQAHTAHLAAASVLPLTAAADAGLWAAALHTGGYLLVTGTAAVLVYRRLGLRLLRTMWINVDLLWGGALVATGALTLVL
ncbi:MAG TPA: hypothetical protein VF046_14875 [Gemmatimonadales bacterium]